MNIKPLAVTSSVKMLHKLKKIYQEETVDKVFAISEDDSHECTGWQKQCRQKNVGLMFFDW